MTAAFDHIAQQYDHEFSWSPIGMLQRKMVWNFLEKEMDHHFSASILELNCGTGEDALWLARHHQNILATDISAEMIKVAAHKALLQKADRQIRFKQMNILDASVLLGGEKFDLVFSNFGGFNCLDKEQFSEWLKNQLPALLRPGGRFVAVLMPGFCAWESLYFLSKFQFRKAFRRLSAGPVQGRLSADSIVNTWYYSPGWISRHLPEEFAITAVKPIGVFIPPSYLNKFFSGRSKFLAFLRKLERGTGQFRAAAYVSDHYLVEIKMKPL